MDGYTLLVDKPAGMTSFGVVARVRRQLSQAAGKKIKVGHTGTLDPFATGLMILVVGKECKNAAAYSKLDKVYEADIVLGQKSSTGDPEGSLTHITDVYPTETAVKNVLSMFKGTITQQPPIYSAIKIGGERAYKLARKGEKIDMPLRQVEVYSIEIIDYAAPHLIIRAHVSSGTYIRTLAEDIGSELHTGAYTAQLRRIKIGDYGLEQCTQDFPL